MDDDFFRRDYDSPHGHDNLFAWTVFILLLIGFALTCWLGSFYVFGHPENPRSYKILSKLKKLEAPKRFDLTAAPPGEFLTPQKLYEKYATMPDYELQQENAELLRNYIRNYQDTKKLVPYIIGRFTILSTYELKSADLFASGVVALAQASDYPQVLVEHTYTADAPTIAQLQRMLAPGLDIKLEKTLDLSAIIHVERLEDGRVQLTAVPLLYGTYALKQGTGTFSLQPPAGLHLEAGVPIIKPATIPASNKPFVAVNSNPSPSPDDEAGTTPAADATPSKPELVRVLPPIAVATPTPLKPSKPTPAPPVIAQATPAPVPTAVPVPSATPRSTPRPVVVASATPSPVQLAAVTTPAPSTPAPEAPATPAPAASSPSPAPGVPLQPFLEAAKPTPALTNTAGSWKVFRPGQMPRGKLVRVADLAGLADRGASGERLYLSGQFKVTASGESRAVLRSQDGGLLGVIGRPANGTTRIIVEFPAGYQPPTEGSNFSRDDLRPFEIRDVRRGADGQINVYVREITAPD